ncbi:hypothetical protein E1H12_22055 [Geitlerinema sp. P-1104]|uniref:hypothetical protein n=1 Tax=Geitlerinema sp. P-1104 TaxID=2546230 RepID=UPI0014768EC3|nr:hypothetical protein [Geitlerinema sp. P-1104]NMG61121.1 hypothetical protein [Geitlerinema sp. P-1104]
MFQRLVQLLSLLAIASVMPISQAIAQPSLHIDSDTSPFRQRELREANLQVSLRYDGHPELSGRYHRNNLHYEIRYREWTRELRIRDSTLTFSWANVKLKDLNQSGTPEVIITTFSGGAHCCTAHKIYSWNGDYFDTTTLNCQQLGGGTFQDINGDGRVEYLTVDQRFFYAFSSFAGSFPPSRILSFEDGDFHDVSRQHRRELRRRAWQMYVTLQERNHEVNGVLAGYVAQKALLGEFTEGWEFMLAHYDPDDDSGIWGYNIYNDEREVIGKHPDFPTALRAFLINSGYIDESDLPCRCGQYYRPQRQETGRSDVWQLRRF